MSRFIIEQCEDAESSHVYVDVPALGYHFRIKLDEHGLSFTHNNRGGDDASFDNGPMTTFSWENKGRTLRILPVLDSKGNASLRWETYVYYMDRDGTKERDLDCAGTWDYNIKLTQYTVDNNHPINPTKEEFVFFELGDSEFNMPMNEFRLMSRFIGSISLS